MEHFAGWKFCSRLASDDEIVDLRGGALLPERALGALEHAVGVWVVGRARSPSNLMGSWSCVVGYGSCVLGRASCVVRRASRRASCVASCVIAHAS